MLCFKTSYSVFTDLGTSLVGINGLGAENDRLQ